MRQWQIIRDDTGAPVVIEDGHGVVFTVNARRADAEKHSLLAAYAPEMAGVLEDAAKMMRRVAALSVLRGRPTARLLEWDAERIETLLQKTRGEA